MYDMLLPHFVQKAGSHETCPMTGQRIIFPIKKYSMNESASRYISLF